MSAISDYDLGWLVGILEGEGYFGFGDYTQIIKVKMCDEDVVIRVANLFEQITGSTFSIYYDIPKTENRSPTFAVKASGENARNIMRLVVKRLGIRRRRRVHQSLNGHEPKKLKIPAAILSKLRIVS